METNNYNTDLQVVSQRVSLRRGKSANQNKKFFNHLSPQKVWKIKGLIIAFLTAYFPLCHLSDSVFLCFPSDTCLDRYDQTRLSLSWWES